MAAIPMLMFISFFLWFIWIFVTKRHFAIKEDRYSNETRPLKFNIIFYIIGFILNLIPVLNISANIFLYIISFIAIIDDEEDEMLGFLSNEDSWCIVKKERKPNSFFNKKF